MSKIFRKREKANEKPYKINEAIYRFASVGAGERWQLSLMTQHSKDWWVKKSLALVTKWLLLLPP